MKQAYEKAKAHVVLFDNSDVITTSIGDDYDWEGKEHNNKGCPDNQKKDCPNNQIKK